VRCLLRDVRAPDRGDGVTFHIPVAFLWGLATPFIAWAVLWLIAVALLAFFGWWVNR
jgi:hypothetical protein